MEHSFPPPLKQVQILLGREGLPARKEFLGAVTPELELTITSHVWIILWKIYKICYGIKSLNIINLERAIYWAAEVTETTFWSGARREQRRGKRRERGASARGSPRGAGGARLRGKLLGQGVVRRGKKDNDENQVGIQRTRISRKVSSSGQVTAALLKLPSHASVCTGMTQKSEANVAGYNICSNAGQISR